MPAVTWQIWILLCGDGNPVIGYYRTKWPYFSHPIPSGGLPVPFIHQLVALCVYLVGANVVCLRKYCVFAQILCDCTNNLCEYCAKNLERRVTSSIIFPDVISHLSVSYVIAYAKFPLVIVRTRASDAGCLVCGVCGTWPWLWYMTYCLILFIYDLISHCRGTLEVSHLGLMVVLLSNLRFENRSILST